MSLLDGGFARPCTGAFEGDFARCELVCEYPCGACDADRARPFVGDFARGMSLLDGDFAASLPDGDFVPPLFVGDFARGEFVGDFARGVIVTGFGCDDPVGVFARGASDPLGRISCTVTSPPTRVICTSARRVPMRTSTGSSVGMRSAIIVAIGEPRSSDVSWSALRGRAVRFVRPFALRIAIGRPTPRTTSVTPSRSRYPRSWSSWPTVL